MKYDMAKGVAIKLVSYDETIPKLLRVIRLGSELQKHKQIVIKPFLSQNETESTNFALVENVVKFCVENKAQDSSIFIAEGYDGETEELFEAQGYKKLAEKYGIGLVDLNSTETIQIGKNEFAGFESIYYPMILKDSFVISVAPLGGDDKVLLRGALANMLGAYPAKHYKGFFSTRKNKLDSYPIKYQLHDIITVKMPEFALIDAKEKGFILAGQPLEIDKQAAKLLGMDWHNIGYLRMIDETLNEINAKVEAEKVKNE